MDFAYLSPLLELGALTAVAVLTIVLPRKMGDDDRYNLGAQLYHYANDPKYLGALVPLPLALGGFLLGAITIVLAPGWVKSVGGSFMLLGLVGFLPFVFATQEQRKNGMAGLSLRLRITIRIIALIALVPLALFSIAFLGLGNFCIIIVAACLISLPFYYKRWKTRRAAKTTSDASPLA